ncbi:hypothetical protein QYM36_020028 [Artemia franciscana]|uniref:Uncharacterized protein n=1 Tax=Artemia franciscana TaxID=6661 RepID=A0AA88H9F6_ARTSF|nr:hypothetical protein QYM36_020028 [Artemia franciscana]
MLCGRVFTPCFMTKVENFSPEMLNLAEKFAEKPIVSENMERAFHEKATLKDKAIFYVNVRKHFIAGIRHILNKCRLEKDGFLEALRFLSPINMKDSRSIAGIATVAYEIKIGASSDVAQTEWLLSQMENGPYEDITWIDHFWSHYFGPLNERRDSKYLELTKLIKAMLMLSPGSADIERGFSCSDSERLYTVVIEEIAGKYGKIYTWEMKSKLMGRIGREAAAALVETVGLPITPEEYIYQSQEIFRRVFPSCEVMPDTEVIYTRCTEEIAARYGKTYPWEVKLKQMGRTAPDLAKVIVEELGLPLLPWEYAAEARIIQEKSFTECQLMPGAEKLVLATSSSEETFKLKTTNHREFFKIFDHIVFGSSDPEVKNGKPAPDIFFICASRFPDKPAPENVSLSSPEVSEIKTPIGIKTGVPTAKAVTNLKGVALNTTSIEIEYNIPTLYLGLNGYSEILYRLLASDGYVIDDETEPRSKVIEHQK